MIQSLTTASFAYVYESYELNFSTTEVFRNVSQVMCSLPWGRLRLLILGLFLSCVIGLKFMPASMPRNNMNLLIGSSSVNTQPAIFNYYVMF